ncbi:MAG: hypothetical protein MJ233_03450 [Mycoplasmoidaceae bacterium]|nr:hypothetical protein [Mycoplasmoidaceae bacterium]
MTEMELHYGRSSFVGLERTIDIQRIRNGPIIPHKVRVIGQQADYEFETHKPIALTFEFETVISFDDGVGFSLPYTAPRNGVSR